MSFGGKQAIVTGAGSGIGAAFCRALACAGAEVSCTDIDGDAAKRTASTLGGSARSARLDVTDASAVAVNRGRCGRPHRAARMPSGCSRGWHLG